MVTSATAVALAVLAIGCSSDIVGSYGPATLNINGTATVVAARMQPIFPETDNPTGLDLDFGWAIAFIQDVAADSPCDDVTKPGVMELNLFDRDNQSDHVLASGTYPVALPEPASGSASAQVTDGAAHQLPSGSVVITAADASHITGTFTADGNVHYDGTFTANRCFE